MQNSEESDKNLKPSYYVRQTVNLKHWTSVTVCTNCGFRAHYKDAHPVDPCFNCGRRVVEKVGKWKVLTHKKLFGLLGKEKGRWILLGEEEPKQ